MANQTMNSEKMYQDLLKRYNGLRNQHLEFLEEQREFLLRSRQNEELTDADLRSRPTSLNLRFSATDKQDENLHKKLSKNDTEENYIDSKLVNSCQCKSTEYLKEVIGVNHKWQEKYDQLLSSYHQLCLNMVKINNELELEKEENCQLKRLVGKLSSDLKKCCTPSSVGKDKFDQEKSYNADEIEALKLQLITYQEDFENERKEKMKEGNEKRQLKETLDETERKLQLLTDEKRRYKQYFEEVSQQKTHLVSELRRLSTSSLPFSPVRQVPRNDILESAAYFGPEDIIPRSSRSSNNLHLIRSSPTAFMGAKAYQG